MATAKTTIFLSIDLEVSGPYPTNGIISCGLCLGEWNNGENTILQNFRVDVNTKEIEFDQDCKVRFWDKNPHLLKEFDKNALPRKDALAKIGKWFDDIDEKYTNDKYNFILVSDRPSLDIAVLNSELFTFTKRRPIDYGPKGEYRSILVVDDALFLDTAPWPKILVEHDHMPENDSRYNFYLACYAYNRKNKITTNTTQS